MRFLDPIRPSAEAKPSAQIRSTYLTARASGVELCDTMRVGTLMAGGIAAFSWLLMTIGV